MKFIKNKEKNIIEVLDRKKNKLGELPLNYNDLSEEQKKIIKKYLAFSKVLWFFVPGLFFLIYQIYWFLLWLILLGILTAEYPIILGLVYIAASVIIIIMWWKLAYNSKSYRVLRKVYKSWLKTK